MTGASGGEGGGGLKECIIIYISFDVCGNDDGNTVKCMQSCISNACVLRACLRKKNKLSDCKTPDDIQGFVANHKTSI